MPNRLRILALNYEYPPLGGGGGVLAEHVLTRFAELGHECTMLTSGFKDLPVSEHRNGVAIQRLPVVGRGRRNTASLFSMLSFDPLARRAGRRLIERENYDVITTFFAVPTGPAGYYLQRTCDLPNALFLLGGDVYDPSKRLSPHRTPLLRSTVARVINGASHVFAGSKDTHASALEHYPITRDIEVVPLSIDAFDLPDPDRAALNLDPDDIVIITIGRVVRRKNVDELIEAMRRLKSRDVQNQKIKLIVIGDGPERERLVKLVADEGLDAHVRLVGNIDNAKKYHYLACADIYASTSIHEGFGLVFLEAMHAGLPVICYDNGGQTDFVRDGHNGFVIALNDLNTFTDSLQRLAEQPKLRQDMRANNRLDVERYYVTTTSDRYIEVLQKLSGEYQAKT